MKGVMMKHVAERFPEPRFYLRSVPRLIANSYCNNFNVSLHACSISSLSPCTKRRCLNASRATPSPRHAFTSAWTTICFTRMYACTISEHCTFLDFSPQISASSKNCRHLCLFYLPTWLYLPTTVSVHKAPPAVPRSVHNVMYEAGKRIRCSRTLRPAQTSWGLWEHSQTSS